MSIKTFFKRQMELDGFETDLDFTKQQHCPEEGLCFAAPDLASHRTSPLAACLATQASCPRGLSCPRNFGGE